MCEDCARLRAIAEKAIALAEKLLKGRVQIAADIAQLRGLVTTCKQHSKELSEGD